MWKPCNRNENQNICPNTLYVACTRATERLYVFEDESNNNEPCFFLNHTHMQLNKMPHIQLMGKPSLWSIQRVKNQLDFFLPDIAPKRCTLA
jgi:hypothetical protein